MSCLSTCLQVIGEWWRSRTIMERFFVIVFVIICVLIIVFGSTGSSALAPGPKCNTSLCLSEASKVLRFRNGSINPCNNFYSYVCGNFLQNAERKEKISLAEFQTAQLIEFYKTEIRKSDHQMVNNAKKLYRACIDQREKEGQQLKTLKKVLKKAGGWPVVEGADWDESAYNWTLATYTLRNLGYPFRIFLDLSIEPDTEAQNSYILKSSTADVTDHLYVLSESDKVELMTDVALIFGAKDRKDTLKQMQDTYDFRKMLKEIQYPANAVGPFIRVKVQDFQQMFDSFNWVEFNNLIIGHPYKLARQHSHLFPPTKIISNWLNLISATPKRTQANYMMWKVVEQTIPYMHCELRAGKGSTKKQETFQEFCLRETEQRFTLSPIRYLVDRKYLPLEKRKLVNKILGSIKVEFVHMLEKVKWIEENDREKLVQRAQNLAFVIGRPENYFGDDVFNELTLDVIQIRLNGSSFMDLVTQANINLETLKYRQFMLARSVSVLEKWYINNEKPEYIKEQNILYIPGTVIQRFFQEQNPNYLNYGKIGAILACQFGAVIADTLDRTNWSENAREEFEKDVICLENEIGKCIEKPTMTPALCLQQALNLAQYTIGMKITYAAYSKWQKENEDFPLIATNYTQNQLFWTAASIMSCPRSINEAFRTDHEFEAKKVFLSVVNNYNFANDFNCPTISEKKC